MSDYNQMQGDNENTDVGGKKQGNHKDGESYEHFENGPVIVQHSRVSNFLLGVFFSVMIMIAVALVMDIFGVITFNGFNTVNREIRIKAKMLTGIINQNFLNEIDEEKMADSVYKGIVAGLDDDYAAYYTAEEYKGIQEKTSGVYCGIGAYISADGATGLVTIVQPMKNSPCEKAGVQAGDIIFAIDGKEVTGEEISQVQAMVKGEQGTKVVLTVIRGDEKKEITVVRDEVEEDTVESVLLDGKIGYLRVSGFERVTSKQFKDALEKLEKQGEESLIIDLRDNGGGLLDSAVDMLERLLPAGVVMYSKDKRGEKTEYSVEKEDSFDKPIAILVNGNSASASEVFSGALQDYEKAVLIGTQTFGKGIVQGIFSLEDGSALKLTTASYYTPKGRNIHGKGLTPDIEVELKEKIEKLPESGLEVDNQVKAAFDYLAEKDLTEP